MKEKKADSKKQLEKVNKELKSLESVSAPLKKFPITALVVICIIFVGSAFIATEHAMLTGFASIGNSGHGSGEIPPDYSAAAAPTQGTPILNSSQGKNSTFENLTVYNISTSDPVKNIITWFRNGSSIMALNLPLDGGSTSVYTKDYTPYGNNGTVSSATWSSTGGYDSFGAYDLTTGEYILVSDASSLDIADQVTLEFWIKDLSFEETHNIESGFFLQDGDAGRVYSSPYYYKHISADIGDEAPPELNDYGDATKKCQKWECSSWSSNTYDYYPTNWDCTQWEDGVCKKRGSSYSYAGRYYTPTYYYYYSKYLDSFTCSSWYGDVCDEWSVSSYWTLYSDHSDWYCYGDWGCTSWYDTDKCAKWDCQAWGTGSTYDDIYCKDGWTCDSWNGNVCQKWHCIAWDFGSDYKDYFCYNDWYCSSWNGDVCSQWKCGEWTNGYKYDIHCNSGWECESWNGESCERWGCVGYSNGTTNNDYRCTSGWECTEFAEFPKKIIGKDGSYYFGVSGDILKGFINSESVNVSLSSISSGWHHIAMAYDKSSIKLYVDGNLESSTEYSSSISTNSNDFMIEGNADFMIDDVRLYNIALPAEQVKALYENRTDIIVSQVTGRNETWRACITPNDGNEDGTEKCSNNLTIFIDPQVVLNYTTPGNPLFKESTVITVEIEDDNTLWVNFTVVDPNGVIVIDNVNGTRNSPWSSPPFDANVTGIWTYNVTAGDEDGFAGTSYGSFDVEYMNISVNFGSNPVHLGTVNRVYGNANLSNGTDVSNVLMNISITANMTLHWYRNTSSSVVHESRFPVVFEALDDFEGKTVAISGQDLIDANPGLVISSIDTDSIEVIDPFSAGLSEEENGRKIDFAFNDHDEDNSFDSQDWIGIELTMTKGERKLVYVYD